MREQEGYEYRVELGHPSIYTVQKDLGEELGGEGSEAQERDTGQRRGAIVVDMVMAMGKRRSRRRRRVHDRHRNRDARG